MKRQRRSRRAARALQIAQTNFDESSDEESGNSGFGEVEFVSAKASSNQTIEEFHLSVNDVAKKPTEKLIQSNESNSIIQSLSNEDEVDPEKWWRRTPDKNTLRVLIATDNHLGYRVNDPIRGKDSFRTMEEIFQIALSTKVDIMVLGGDLFHNNKPSRKTMHEALRIFRKYTFGSRNSESGLKVMSKDNNAFSRDHDKVFNAQNPLLNVRLPVFGIHGNHDDPTRDGTDRALSAMDILQMAGVINYYGVQDQVDKVDIEPILITKGTSKLSLYGLGWMRDERLYNLFTSGKVKFQKPTSDEEEMTSWYHMFMVHQNRQNKGRGNKNCLQENFLPSFLDLVVFGHEHECRAAFEESISEPINFCQPGSSVATSLVAGEEIKKQIVILEIALDNTMQSSFRYKLMPLRTVRPFMMREISLSTFKHLDDAKLDNIKLKEAKKQELMIRFLEAQVKEVIEEAKSAFSSENPQESSEEVKGMLPLIRLRVEYSGYPMVNLHRFGARFTSTTANPSELISYFKRRKPVEKSKKKNKNNESTTSNLSIDFGDVETAPERISVLVESLLDDPSRKLKLLDDKELSVALNSFVMKQQSRAIEEFVSVSMSDVQDWLRKSKSEKNQIFNEKEILKLLNDMKVEVGIKQTIHPKVSVPKVYEAKAPVAMDFEGMDEETEEQFCSIPEGNPIKKKNHRRRRNISKRSKTKVEVNDLLDLSEPSAEGKPKKTRLSGKRNKKKAAVINISSNSETDTDMDSTPLESLDQGSKRKSTAPPTRRSPRRQRRT